MDIDQPMMGEILDGMSQTVAQAPASATFAPISGRIICEGILID